MGFFSYLTKQQRREARYRRIYDDPDLRAESKYCGITSIVYSVLTVAFAVGALFFIGLMGGGNPILIIFGLLLGICFAMGALLSFINSLIYLVKQRKMNHKVVGIFALIFFFLSLIGVGIAAFILLKI